MEKNDDYLEKVTLSGCLLSAPASGHVNPLPGHLAPLQQLLLYPDGRIYPGILSAPAIIIPTGFTFTMSDVRIHPYSYIRLPDLLNAGPYTAPIPALVHINKRIKSQTLFIIHLRAGNRTGYNHPMRGKCLSIHFG
jgi:hypothetical protein